jgi:predicted dehydrogenase
MVAGNVLFESGVAFSGSWCFSADAALEKDHCEILGTKGKLSFTVFSGNTIFLQTGGKTVELSFDQIQHAQQPMIGATVRYFLGEGPNPCTGREGAEVMRIMEAFVG